ncbi:hypothetical protein [Clostridium nigeriense]|uniref:hypothetical protein n=1 Tax=Clostridium nigeriense TaxID=1805470 RepID=UPI000829C0AD|nr:hypothetical protein [Clostridium nigeriense]
MDEGLNLQFVSDESYVYSWAKDSKAIEFHLHVGKYYCDRLYIIINDRSININRDIKFLNYIDRMVAEFELKMCDIFGFFKKGRESAREIQVEVSFNSFNICYPPIMHDELKDTLKTIREDVFSKVEKMKLAELF